MATYGSNVTIQISSFVDVSGTTTVVNQVVYTVPAGKAFVGTIVGGAQTGVSGGGNAVIQAGPAIVLGPGRTVRIPASGSPWFVSGILIDNSP